MVLQSLAEQTYRDFEVIIADDGSDEKTAALIAELKASLPFAIQHVWQEDEGFRAAKIRNKAVAKARGDYLIFLDGDCVVPKNFLARQQKFAQQGWFLAGNRILLAENFTKEVLQKQIPIYTFGVKKWCVLRFKSQCNRILPLLFLPNIFFRKLRTKSWHGVKTCNLGVWYKDFIAVNGFDESFKGWGYEDSDLVIRLLKNGVKRKDGRFALTVFHLWHPQQDRKTAAHNFEKLTFSQLGDIKAHTGIDQYLKSGDSTEIMNP